MTEDPFYNAQTVEDEIMLATLALSGRGVSNDEIATGLWKVLSSFADATEGDYREGMIFLVESLLDDLRTHPPRVIEPDRLARVAWYRLASQARQEGRD